MTEDQARLLALMRDDGKKLVADGGGGWRAMGFAAEIVAQVVAAGWTSDPQVNEWQQQYRTLSPAGLEALAAYESAE